MGCLQDGACQDTQSRHTAPFASQGIILDIFSRGLLSEEERCYFTACLSSMESEISFHTAAHANIAVWLTLTHISDGVNLEAIRSVYTREKDAGPPVSEPVLPSSTRPSISPRRRTSRAATLSCVAFSAPGSLRTQDKIICISLKHGSHF